MIRCILLCLVSTNLLAVPAFFTIDRSKGQSFSKIKESKLVKWWLESADALFIKSDTDNVDAIDGIDSYRELKVKPNGKMLYFADKVHIREIVGSNLDVLFWAGRTALLQMKTDGLPKLTPLHRHKMPLESAAAHSRIRLFRPNQVLSFQGEAYLYKKPWKGVVDDALKQIDVNNWLKYVDSLADYNRYARGKEVIEARDWIKKQMTSFGKLKVTTEEFAIRGGKSHNVVGILEGSDPNRKKELYLVGGHYDSISQNTAAAAPGAVDNASGTASVLEMARIFSKLKPKSTIVFIAFGAEEIGLLGSEAYVKKIIAANQKKALKGALITDMLGYTKSGKIQALYETHQFATGFSDVFVAAAKKYTTMKVQVTFNAFGSDHMPFLRNKIPALLTIDQDYSVYPQYHRTNDNPEALSKKQGENMLRTNVAAIAQLTH